MQTLKKECMQLILIFLLCFSLTLYPTTPLMTISEAGSYELGANLSFNATTPTDSIILINSNNVVLDLKDHILVQTNPATAMLAGIAVAPNLTNVKIQNGMITGVNGAGVLVQSGDQVVSLNNITTASCAIGVNIQNSSYVNLNNIMTFLSTTTSISMSSSNFVNLDQIISFSSFAGDGIAISQSNNCNVRNSLVSNCSGQCISAINGCSFLFLENLVSISGVTGGINISQGNNCTLNNSAIINCGTGGSTAFNVSASQEVNATNCKFLRNGNNNSAFSVINLGVMVGLFRDLTISTSMNNTLTGIALNGSSQLVFENCNVINSFASTFNGFNLSTNATFSCLFDNCSVTNCSTTGTFQGFVVNANTNNIFNECSLMNNQAQTGIVGFNITSPSSFLSINSCDIENNITTSNTFVGISCTGATKTQILNTQILNNMCGTLMTGLLFSGCNSCNIQNVHCYNLTSTSGGAFGFDIINSTSCQLIKCQAMNITGTAATTVGILLSGCRDCTLTRCMGNNQTARNSQAIGIEFINTISCGAQDCIAIRNVGSNVANTIGYLQSGAVGSTFVRNSSLGHPTLNFSGFNANNFVVPSGATDTNSTCSAWTNFGITG